MGEAMFGISTFEMLIVGIVAIMLFGNRLPSVARSLGKSLNEFKRGMREFENEVKSTVYSEPVGRVTHQEKLAVSKPAAEESAVEDLNADEASGESLVAEVQHQ
jgi:TatA/E family protein of Tat protein translocase